MSTPDHPALLEIPTVAYAFVALFIVIPIAVLGSSLTRTLRNARDGKLVPGPEPISRWGDQVGPTLREHQRLAEAKRRPSPFTQSPEARLLAGQRPALGAVPARVRRGG